MAKVIPFSVAAAAVSHGVSENDRAQMRRIIDVMQVMVLVNPTVADAMEQFARMMIAVEHQS